MIQQMETCILTIDNLSNVKINCICIPTVIFQLYLDSFLHLTLTCHWHCHDHWAQFNQNFNQSQGKAKRFKIKQNLMILTSILI